MSSEGIQSPVKLHSENHQYSHGNRNPPKLRRAGASQGKIATWQKNRSEQQKHHGNKRTSYNGNMCITIRRKISVHQGNAGTEEESIKVNRLVTVGSEQLTNKQNKTKPDWLLSVNSSAP